VSNRVASLIPPGRWRAVLAALAVGLSIGAVGVWTWYQLDRHQQREDQHRFELNIQALGEILKTRMQSYELVLRGLSGAFAGDIAREKSCFIGPVRHLLFVYFFF